MREAGTEMLWLPTHNETFCIPLEAIIRVEASSNYSKVYCRDQAYPIVAAKLLRWFEEKLPDQDFTRIHRTHLVNKKYITSVRKNNILLESGTSLSISRRKKKSFFDGLSRSARQVATGMSSA